MNETQKIIKYFAIAFAIFLIVSIVSAIMFCLASLGDTFSDNSVGKLRNLNVNQNTKILNIDVSYTKLTIKKGNKFKIETDNKNITCNQKDNTVEIKEKDFKWFIKNNNSSLIVYIPDNYTFDEVSITNGAGKVDIKQINTNYLNLDLGAGKIEIDNLNVSSSFIISGGAGEISILDGNIANLDLDMGVGKMTLNAKITGNSKIDAGVGEIELNLLGSESDYKIKSDKGVGLFKIAGTEVKDNTVYGSGANIIDIDGGVGSIDIKFSN